MAQTSQTATADLAHKPMMNMGQILLMNVGFFGIQYSFGMQQNAMSPIYQFLGASQEELPILNLAGLDVPSNGEVWLDGMPIHAANEDARAALRAQAVGFVFQNFQLMPAMSALDNVALPLELRGEHGGEAARALLRKVGLGERLHHLPRQLSGGEQQRVAIARAFVARPRILFADEPTGNLDRRTGLAIEDLLFGMDDARQTTVVVVTHDERLAARCDRQLRLDAGRLVA